MRITDAIKRLRIYLGESDQWRGRPLYAELIVDRPTLFYTIAGLKPKQA